MPEIELTQSEADTLIAMEKRRIDGQQYEFPMAGEKLSVPLQSVDRREQFLLDINRGRIDLKKCTYQNRARQVVVLLRLDIAGPPHRNPVEEEIPCPHLHVYREGCGEKWAVPLPAECFTGTDDLWDTLEEFMRYCNITEIPVISKGLLI